MNISVIMVKNSRVRLAVLKHDDNKKKNYKPNLHVAHRSRLKRRFINDGIENFEDHNILELLLFYGIPRKDTNPIAHELIDCYGSLSAVFDADFDDLKKQKNVGENTAVLIKLIPALARAYMLDKETRYESYNNMSKIGDFLVNYYIGATRERAAVVLLNNKMEMMRCIALPEGTINAATVNYRTIAELGFKYQAACFILAHNHPDGSIMPSAEDIALTENLKRAFASIEFPLIDHIIVAGDNYKAIIRDMQIDKRRGYNSMEL